MLPLVKACKWKQVEEALRGNPPLITFRDKRGRNWLHLCCGADIRDRRFKAADSIKTVEILLNAGLEINGAAFQEQDFQATPLWYAVGWGRNLVLAEWLLKRGSNPNHCLHAAAFNNDVDAVRLLIRYGAEIDPNVEDGSPFLFAVQWSRFDAAEELLKLGANVDFQNSKKMTALHCVLKKGSDKKHVRMLLRYGARLDIPNDKGVTAGAIMSKKRDPEFRDMAVLDRFA
jgi:ankyrin repeat protein